ESPHILLSMGTNAGKSSAVKAMVVPLLMEGAQAYILDPKWNSHTWAMNIPNVHICSSVSAMFDALVWLGEDWEGRQTESALFWKKWTPWAARCAGTGDRPSPQEPRTARAPHSRPWPTAPRRDARTITTRALLLRCRPPTPWAGKAVPPDRTSGLAFSESIPG